MGNNRFQGVDLEEIQEQIDTTSEEAKLMEDKLMEMRASKPEPDHEEEDRRTDKAPFKVLENKLA